MEKEKLREEWMTLLRSRDLSVRLDILDTFANFILNLGYRYNEFPSERLTYAGTMLQMFATKNISLQQMVKGIEYRTSEGISLNNILDSTTIIPHTRTIYELLCTFELVYILPDTDEKKLILFNLWRIAGLNNRQSFFNEDMQDSHIEKCKAEALEIETYTEEIKSTNIYQVEKNRKIIDKQIKDKKYQIIINEDNEVEFYGWKAVPSYIGMDRGGLFKNTYNYFSMYAHSSYIAALQFDAMFKNRDDKFIISGRLLDSIIMYSVFISDYMQLFPKTKEYFFQQDIRTQMRIRMFAKMVREESVDLDKNWQNIFE